MFKLTAATGLAGLLAIAICLASCGSSNNIVQPQPGIDLPWPPPAGAIKISSDDTFLILGNDVASSGGTSYPQSFPPNSFQLSEDNKLPWATYSLAGFGAEIHFTELAFNCEIRPTGPGDGTMLYLGFANYTTGGWEWFIPGDGMSVHPVPDDTDYVSPTGVVNFAVVHYSPNPFDEPNGYSNILSLEIERTGNTEIAPPTGLTASPALNEITLDWQAVATSEGYHIYRDIHKDFPAPLKLTDGAPLTVLTYVDETVERGVMYYYKASSIRDVVESELSPFVDMYSPEYTKPTPTPLEGYSQGINEYVAKWDWSGQFPDFFRVYYSAEPDFNMELPIDYVQVTGGIHQATLDLSGIGSTVYWRVCPYQSSKHGFMTDDQLGQAIAAWEWGPAEELGDGIAPMALAKVAGDYSAVYINGTNVDFSRRDGGTWATETAMSDDTFGGFIGLSYGGGEYAIATQDSAAHDLYMASGTPGTWSGARVHGNDDAEDGRASSGNNIQLASSATEHMVVHLEFDGSVMAHTKPAGSGSWSAETNLWTASMLMNYMSLAELDSNFFMLWLDMEAGELMFSDRDGGWVQTNVLADGVAGVGEYNSLTHFDGEWWTPGFNSTPGQRNLHFLNGTAAPWTENLNQNTGHTGELASMAALDTKLFCIYFRRDVPAWEFGLYDGTTWETNWFLLPGVEFTMPVAGGLGDVPLVLYDDTGTGKIMAVTGAPPA